MPMLRQVDSTIQQVVKEFGRIDSVTNCVGSVLLKSAHTTSDKEASPPPPHHWPLLQHTC